MTDIEKAAHAWLAAEEAYEEADRASKDFVHDGSEATLEKMQKFREMSEHSMYLLRLKQHMEELLRAEIRKSRAG